MDRSLGSVERREEAAPFDAGGESTASNGGVSSGRPRSERVRLSPGGPTGFVLVVYNILYWPYLLSTCVLLFFPALVLFAVTAPFDPKRRALHWYTCLWGAHYLAWAPLAGVRVEGREHARAAGPCIFVSNHQSMVDILAVFALRMPFLWVSKIENFYVPFLGWNMWLNNYVPLRRGYLPSIMRMVRTCQRRLKEGHSLCVFPEGTRSPDGNLIRFYPGAFRLAVRNRVPIVPVVIDGTQVILPKKQLFIRPRPVVMRILPAIYPEAAGNDHKRLLEQVKTRMQHELDVMRGV
ncbi:MAG TPA: lysophospholipid acyltransferase family protein [Polyangiaceae bacterium]|nr:lysophospholipid acyltransferase family protein [Polyangiaceae bacterium]